MHNIRFTTAKIANRLELIRTLSYMRRQTLLPFRLHSGESPIVQVDVDDGDWPVIESNNHWGQSGRDFTLRTSFTVPDDWQAPIEIFLPIESADNFIHPEALAYIDGLAHQGVNAYQREIVLQPCWHDDAEHVLALHGWLGLRRGSDFIGQPEIAQVHQPTRDFIAAARVALGVLLELGEDDPIRTRLLNALDEAFRELDLRVPFGDGFYNSVQSALPVLENGIAAAGFPLSVDIIAVGHAHLDTAWLWPIDQTRRKVARTFSNILRLMEEYPEFIFTQSQPQLYLYISEDHPNFFEQIKVYVAEGRWEVVGGMWVEADCNLAGAESLVRQLLLGRSYFRQEFGEAESPILWLPDTFGFPWSLPQLIKHAGLEYFLTSKLSWNQYNRLPYDSFWWQGLDGERILTHFITTPDVAGNPYHTYNGDLAPKRVIGTWRNYQQKETHTELLTAFGWGDGGGGPTREMLENGQRLANHPGAPRVRLSKAGNFFQNLEERAGTQLPVWNGELYLEYHRGTYSSHAWIKRANRKAEFLMHDAEFLAAWAAMVTDYTYPHADLARAWRLLCLNQFHDIITGACINRVYQDSHHDFELIRTIGEQVREASLRELSKLLPEEAEFIAVNPTSFGGQQIGLLPERLDQAQTLSELATGRPLVTQLVEEGTLVEIPHIGPYGYVALGITDASSTSLKDMPMAQLMNGDGILENDALRVEFDKAGDIHRIFDKNVGREVIPRGQQANHFEAFEDRPLHSDAWNIDIFYDDKYWTADPASSLSVIENGPLRAGLEIRRRLLESEIVQRIYLYKGDRRLDFDTWVDWQERNVLLKVAFPVDVLSPEATYDIQWGNIRRPTHRNTSWDWARFEVCAHKWVDMSEGEYGVSLLNDCKYGHDVLDNVIRLTLLRGTTFPDPEADRGEHHFIYSLLPHPGSWYSVSQLRFERSYIHTAGNGWSWRRSVTIISER